MPKHPALKPSRIKWTMWCTWAVAAFTLALVLWLVSARQADQHNQAGLRATVDNLSTLAAQNQAQLGKLGERPVGPPAKSVAEGKATPPPTDIAPVTPTAPASGEPGRGITSTEIGGGHLFVHYSDHTTKDVGRVVGKNGTDGDDGKDGEPGRGIVASTIQDGALVVSYTDHTTQNLGRVVGQAGTNGHDGSDGTAGRPGRGVATSSIVAGHLFVTYTDHTVEDVGRVVGSDGLDGDSITGAAVDSAGHLQVTITNPNDGTTRVIDAGYVIGAPGKAGTDGADGQDGQPPVGWTVKNSDGVTTQTCTRADNFDPASPRYACTSTGGAATTPPTSDAPTTSIPS